MANSLFETTYNPDVLTCLANLSNDEVFTPPNVVNDMLDMLPQELFENPDTTFLDPVCKSGVFLREIAKRLIKGLEKKIPDLQKRVDHIYKEQLFGIAITELTSFLSRRSLYCSKAANRKYSVVKFDDVQGNIRYKAIEHRFQNGKCVYCSASEKTFGPKSRPQGTESHAYEWIHTLKPEEIWNMKFDVIVGNPPYQLDDGGSKASAKPIYHSFIEQAKKLNPKFLTMIIPARWYSGGKGLDDFRSSMLSDKRIRKLVDFFDSTECFPGVDISGGVCYFLWDRDNKGDCLIETHRNGSVSQATRPLFEAGSSSFIRFNEAVSIVRKVAARKEQPFSKPISSRKPFGISTNETIYSKNAPNYLPCFAYPENGFIPKNKVTENSGWVDAIKVCISYAYGERGSFPYQVIGRPFIAPAGSCCTETYLVIRTCASTQEADNIISYMSSEFFRFLVLLRKNTQHATKTVYELVPEQDYSHPWTDEMLFQKYGITKEEQQFIHSMIKPFAGSEK